MSDYTQLGSSTFISRQMNESIVSPSSSSMPLGNAPSAVRTMAQEGRVAGNDGISGDLGKISGRLRTAINSSEGEGEEEIQDARPIVMTIVSTAQETEFAHHQLLMINTGQSEGTASDKRVDVWNIAKFNLTQRATAQRLQDTKGDSPARSKLKQFADDEVEAAIADSKYSGIDYGTLSKSATESSVAKLNNLLNNTADNIIKESYKKALGKLNTRQVERAQLPSLTSEDSDWSRMYMCTTLRNWRRLGVLESTMMVTKLAPTLSSIMREDVTSHSVLGVHFSGPLEVRNIWPYHMNNGSHLYLIYCAWYSHSAEIKPSSKYTGPIVIFPWASDGPVHSKAPLDVSLSAYKDLGGHTAPVAIEYIGTIIDLKECSTPSFHQVMQALGLTTNELHTANVAHDKLPTIKINLRH